MRRLALLVALAVAAPVVAREVAGVVVPDRVTESGVTLPLNGAGLRTKWFFKVYVAGLYLEHPSRDADAIVHADAVRRIDLRILRSLDAKTIAESIAEGFERNSRDREAVLRDRLERLKGMFPSVKEGDTISLAYVPGRGTIVRAQNADRGTIDGKDFADALFAVWLGPDPVDARLEADLLGG